MDNPRNLILAVVLSLLLFVGWDMFSRWYFPAPEPTVVEESISETASPATGEGGLDGDGSALADEGPRDIETELASTDRIAIAGPRISGTINPVGAKLDDLTLNDYRETLDDDSGPVRMFSPAGTEDQYFTLFGWTGEGLTLPDARTVWQAEGDQLTRETPVTLRWDNGAGQVFSIRFEVDENYMLSTEQTVTNGADGPIVVQPYSFITRTSSTDSLVLWNVHTGPIGSFDEAVEFGYGYGDLDEAPLQPNSQNRIVVPDGSTDWIGFTDRYWLTVLVPQGEAATEPGFLAMADGTYRAGMAFAPATVAAGSELSRTTNLFAGAKESDLLSAYEDAGNVNFDRAIDWGWFEIIEKPIIWLLRQLFGLVGNFGVAIMLLTVIVRGLMFPIAQKQFASMAAMRAIQPKMKALQERYKDDKPKQQQEIMALYKKEGVNPLAGCLPIFLQIPIFFALYKVLILAVDMRHQPFALWIQDLSAPDPAHFLNLFGLLDFTVPGLLAIGPLALFLGVTMWLQFKLNPAQMDPTQQQIFMILPWVLMFVMANFAAGLLLYWGTSNVLTIAQQWYLYSRHPQLKAQADKDKVDRERADKRDKKG